MIKGIKEIGLQERDEVMNNHFKEIEHNSRIYLDPSKPLVIRLDGKNVTKDKENYDLTFKDGYACEAMNSAIRTLKGFGCEAELYSITDEISIIIYDSISFFRNFEEPNQLYCSVIFLQRFLSFFRTFSATTEFGISMFNLSVKDVSGYLKWRKEFGKNAAVVYAAKKFNIPFHDRTNEEIIADIASVEPEWYETHMWFFEGITDTTSTEVTEEITIEF